MSETINERIKRYRNAAKLTQCEVAEMLGEKRSTYANMEKNGNIRAETVMKLSAIFGIDPKELLGMCFIIPESPVQPFEQNKEPFEIKEFTFTENEKNIILKIRSLKPEDAEMVEKIIEKFLDTKTQIASEDTEEEE